MSASPFQDGPTAEPTAPPTDKWPEIEDGVDILANPPEPPEVLIKGVLNKGEMMLIGGEAKLGKTWIAIQAGLCVATGTPWLGYSTQQAPVLFINLELTKRAFYERLEWMARSLGIDLQRGEFSVWNLRGFNAEMSGLVEKILATPPDAVGLIVPDPVYKTLGRREENKAEDVADLLLNLDRLTKELEASVLLTHHFAKGAASSKDNIDQFSGSGVWVRHPDVLANMKRLKEADTIVLSMTVRNSKSPPDMGLRLDFPVMVPDQTLDITKIKGMHEAKPKSELASRNFILDLFLTEFDESNPRSSVLSNGQVENALKKANHSKGDWRGVRDDLISEKFLGRIDGLPRNEQLYGVPEVVEKYREYLKNPPLIPKSAKVKKRRK